MDYWYDVTWLADWAGPSTIQSLEELPPSMRSAIVRAHERGGSPEAIEILSSEIKKGALRVMTKSAAR
jgi:hypothetical protein